MTRFRKSVKANILLGYFTLVLIGVVTVWIIYNETVKLTDNQVDINPVSEKILLVNSVLTNLYEAEGLERSYLLTGNSQHLKSYNLLMDSIVFQVESFAQNVTNPQQQMHIDSIQNLLMQKRQNMKEIIATKNAGTSEKLYQRALVRLTSNKDSVNQLLSIYKTVTTNKDSIIVKQSRKKFFDRLVNVFLPQEKADSSLKIVVNQSMQVDSILNGFNPADSVSQLLTSPMEEIRMESKLFEKQLLKKEQEILENDKTITIQIRQILSKLEKEELMKSIQKVEIQQSHISNITTKVIILGAVAMIVVILFLILILKDITKSQHWQNLEKEKAYSESLLKSKEKLMLSNLISNAIKFTDKGKVTFAGSVSETNDQTDFIKFEVTDTGIGISSENINEIFEEFTRGSLNGSNNYEGNGLGLTNTKRIVELLNGKIFVSSNYGKGSKFTLVLPLQKQTGIKPEGGQNGKETETTWSKKISFNNEHVLLVVDDPVLLEMTTIILRQAELRVSPFSSPMEAQKIIRKMKYDILITDIQMPRMNGFELLYFYRQNNHNTHAIALTGMVSNKEVYENAGFNAILTKPFVPEDILKQVFHVLNGKQNNFSNSQYEDNNFSENYSIEGIAAFANGDQETIKKILVSFVQSTSQNLQLYNQYLHAGNFNALSELAHKMLAMFRQLEAETIVEPLYLLEQNNFEKTDFPVRDKTARTTLFKIEKLMEKLKKDYQIT